MSITTQCNREKVHSIQLDVTAQYSVKLEINAQKNTFSAQVEDANEVGPINEHPSTYKFEYTVLSTLF